MSGYGVGTFLFNYMTSVIVNAKNTAPRSVDFVYDDRYFEFDIAKRVPLMLYCVLAIWIILFGMAVAFVSKKKPKKPRDLNPDIKPKLDRKHKLNRAHSVNITDLEMQNKI
jgi:hypothetical protein